MTWLLLPQTLNMESNALHFNKAISTLPWLLLLTLVSIIFLQFAPHSSVNIFLISTTIQTRPIPENKTITPIPKDSSSPTNSTGNEDVSQMLPLNAENITVGSQRAELAGSNGESCDLFSGKWLKDPIGPIYTNLTCPTIPDDDNCWRYGKEQGYAYWRWKPDGCELQKFEPRVFLNVVRGKKMAFIGDSLARNHMESLLCLLTQEETPIDIFKDGKNEIRTWFFPNYSFTLMALRSNFLVEATERIINGTGTDTFNIHLDRVSQDWTTKLLGVHYAIISSGNWFIRKNYMYDSGKLIGCIHCKDEGITHLDRGFAIRRVYRTTLEFISKHQEYKEMLTLLRTFTPSHFENGSWFDGGDCKRTQPLDVGDASLTGSALEFWKIQSEEVERMRKGERRGNKIGVLDVTRAMMARADGHPGSHINRRNYKTINDCLHWCLPGPIDTWSDVLLRIIEKDT